MPEACRTAAFMNHEVEGHHESPARISGSGMRAPSLAIGDGTLGEAIAKYVDDFGTLL
jgi:hypothetical protein